MKYQLYANALNLIRLLQVVISEGLILNLIEFYLRLKWNNSVNFYDDTFLGLRRF